MQPRTLDLTIRKAVKTFPALVVTGPRQSGKTTLLKTEFGKTHHYYNLENPDMRLRAKSDPIGFLKQLQYPIILDEIQYVPELLPYIKTGIDENRKPGQWLLTGSQNFALMAGVSESLAGRAAILSLLPFTLAERFGYGLQTISCSQFLSFDQKITKIKSTLLNSATSILRGSYPELVSNPRIDREIWCGSYITTYLERDIRNLKQVGDLGQFEIFLRACAVRTGQILDLSSISREIGVSFTTVKRWLSLLETGYQVYLLYPYYRNIGKRLVKRPKLYFSDTGLASYLLGIHTPEMLFASVTFGALFETLVVTDFWKRFLHHGQSPSMYYLKTQDDLEIDLVIELGNQIHLAEIKSSSTIHPKHASSLMRIQKELGNRVGTSFLISDAKDSYELPNNIKHIPISSLIS